MSPARRLLVLAALVAVGILALPGPQPAEPPQPLRLLQQAATATMVSAPAYPCLYGWPGAAHPYCEYSDSNIVLYSRVLPGVLWLKACATPPHYGASMLLQPGWTNTRNRGEFVPLSQPLLPFTPTTTEPCAIWQVPAEPAPGPLWGPDLRRADVPPTPTPAPSATATASPTATSNPTSTRTPNPTPVPLDWRAFMPQIVERARL